MTISNAEMAHSHGHITRADLAAYRAVWREPLVGEWDAYNVITAPLPSSGGIALLSMLSMKRDLAAAFAGVAPNSPQYVHLLAEIEKRVFADRAEYLGDPDFHPARWRSSSTLATLPGARARSASNARHRPVR